MCGIVGIVGCNRTSASLSALRDAVAALRHRGPDADGFFEDDHALLGHRRLSILDTRELANQPMESPSGGAVLVYNGEIYNFRALRDALETRGEAFVTNGDTEVVLRLLEQRDIGALPQMEGMFAFGLWRPRQRQLLLARDRFGEKPLYFAPLGKGLAFASEIRALLAFPDVARHLDVEALGYYLESGCVPAPLTMFAGIRSLGPGQWLRWADGNAVVGDYYAPTVDPDPTLNDPREATAAVREALSSAVRRQMVSDVPLGALLSGGIDSSSVVAMMQRESSRPIKTFSVRFEQAQYDESRIATRVAEHLGTEHHVLTVADASFREADLWRIIDHVGLPFHDSSAIPMYVVSSFARKHVTVALSGDGGDEMFAGYPTFSWAARVNRIAGAPNPLLGAAAIAVEAAGRTPPFRGSSRLRQTRKALEFAQIGNDALRFRALYRLFAPSNLQAILQPRVMQRPVPRPRDLLAALPAGARGWTTLRRAMYIATRSNLACDMLVKVDRMSMASSLEVRAPFLDPLVADVSARLPDHHLIHGKIGKWIVREAMRPFLPAEVFSQPKWGFSIPLHSFMNAEFRMLARELLAPGGPLAEVVEPTAIAEIAERGLSRVRDRADVSVYQATHQAWALVQLAAWMKRFRVSMA